MNDKTTEAGKVAKAMAALDMIATVWAASFDIRLAVCSMKSLPDGDDRLIAFVKQAHCEGFYAGRTSLQVAQPVQSPVIKKLQVTLQDSPVDVELAQYKRMFEAACIDLGLINEALELDPNDGGAEPILKGITALKAAIVQPVQPTPDADFKESVALMLAAVGYTETYARQWPNEKVSVTFKRWFDEQIENAKTAQPEQPSKGLFIDMIAAHGTGFAAEMAASIAQPVQPSVDTQRDAWAALEELKACAQSGTGIVNPVAYNTLRRFIASSKLTQQVLPKAGQHE